jgi:hypothetical protein
MARRQLGNDAMSSAMSLPRLSTLLATSEVTYGFSIDIPASQLSTSLASLCTSVVLPVDCGPLMYTLGLIIDMVFMSEKIAYDWSRDVRA